MSPILQPSVCVWASNWKPITNFFDQWHRFEECAFLLMLYLKFQNLKKRTVVWNYVDLLSVLYSSCKGLHRNGIYWQLGRVSLVCLCKNCLLCWLFYWLIYWLMCRWLVRCTEEQLGVVYMAYNWDLFPITHIRRRNQSPVQWNVSFSETVRNKPHVYIKFYLEWEIIWPPGIFTFRPLTIIMYY